MIKYIGSKRAMLEPLTGAVAALLPDGGRVCDLFSGSARVGRDLKAKGLAAMAIHRQFGPTGRFGVQPHLATAPGRPARTREVHAPRSHHLRRISWYS